MNVLLNPQSEELVRSKIASGRYDDASGLLHEALTLLDERDRDEELRAAAAIGVAQAERGELVPFDMERAKRLAAENSRRGHKVDPLVLP